jgi:4a-hydroxytetrahydrobiopterin dehydratase
VFAAIAGGMRGVLRTRSRAGARSRTTWLPTASESAAEVPSGIVRSVDGWEEQDDALVREFEFESFPKAIAFVDRLADAAESANHHPDIDIRFRKVTVRWTTHSEGGITAKDREMAELSSTLAST